MTPRSQFIQNILRMPGSVLDTNIRDIFHPRVDCLVQYRIQIPSVTDRQVVLVDAPGFDRGSVVNAILADPQTKNEYKIRAVTRDTTSDKAKALQAKGAETVTVSFPIRNAMALQR